MKELTKIALFIIGIALLAFIGLSDVGMWSLVIIYCIWITR